MLKTLDSVYIRRVLRLTAPTVAALALLFVLTPTKQDYRHQVIDPHIAGIRADLRAGTTGIRALGRSLFPGLAEVGRELSSAYWEEVSEQIDTATRADQFGFLAAYKTTWSWGVGVCETFAYGIAGFIWIGRVDTCELGHYRR